MAILAAWAILTQVPVDEYLVAKIASTRAESARSILGFALEKRIRQYEGLLARYRAGRQEEVTQIVREAQRAEALRILQLQKTDLSHYDSALVGQVNREQLGAMIGLGSAGKVAGSKERLKKVRENFKIVAACVQVLKSTRSKASETERCIQAAGLKPVK